SACFPKGRLETGQPKRKRAPLKPRPEPSSRTEASATRPLPGDVGLEQFPFHHAAERRRCCWGLGVSPDYTRSPCNETPCLRSFESGDCAFTQPYPLLLGNRHSSASFLMAEGENPAVIQATLRHTRLDVARMLITASRNIPQLSRYCSVKLR